jgi:hypothetical protein
VILILMLIYIYINSTQPACVLAAGCVKVTDTGLTWLADACPSIITLSCKGILMTSKTHALRGQAYHERSSPESSIMEVCLVLLLLLLLLLLLVQVLA